MSWSSIPSERLSSYSSFMWLWILVLYYAVDVTSYSIEKQIFDSAPSVEMFDTFHIMPDAEVKVMTEFDILVTLDQYKSMYESSEGSRKKRKAVSDKVKRWDDCKVYYEISPELQSAKTIIKLAIDEWEKYTCLEFIENRWRNQRIVFRDGGGCYSELGMQNKTQVLVLAEGCRSVGIVVHEIGHAIGWIHEHMRPDRDKYVMINDKAIPHKYKPNYRKYDVDVINDYGIPYDYKSIMHYGNDALPGSIITLDPSFQDEIGQRLGFTFKDLKLANIMYDCAKVMGCKLKVCKHNGFQLYKTLNGKDACECWCDSGKVDDPLILCSSIDKELEPPQPSPPPTEVPVVNLCYDMRDDCSTMKASGFCMTKTALMMDVCSKTCDFCGKGENMCMDHEKGCPLVAATGECTNPKLEPMLSTLCPASCGFCKKITDPCSIQFELMGDIRNLGVRGHMTASSLLLTVTLIFLVLTTL